MRNPTLETKLDEPDLGSCCACGDSGRDVRNILCLHKKAPTPGHGWGCVMCDLPNDGAVCVLCDRCLSSKALPKWACRGFPATGDRVPIQTLTGIHQHNLLRHPEVLPGWYRGPNPVTTWCITDHPSDHPEHFVVRAHCVVDFQTLPSTEAMIFDTLGEARRPLIEAGLTRLRRSPVDDPVIVETWM